MSDIELDYDYLTQRALRRVVYDILSIAADLGKAPGEHHFYIEFATKAAGVSIPDHLIAAYPERMTIVLQHQFENLDVGEDQFSVSLWFKGKQAHLTIPYETITSFADPSVQFGIRFDAEQHDENSGVFGEHSTVSSVSNLNSANPEPANPKRQSNEDVPDESRPEKESASDAAAGADVVELDAFRKK